MQLDEAPTPEPGPGEVRLRLRVCGVNFADTLMIRGTYQVKAPLPFSPGLEVCGIVDAIGPDVGKLAPGMRVAATIRHGGFADFAIADAVNCIPAPDGMPDEEVAAILIAYGTSHMALTDRAHLRPDETLLVLGAAGGVGLTAVEVGKQLGATVIACARGAEKLAIAAERGADHLIDTDTQNIREEVLALGGADVVYDPVGGEQWKAAMRATNPDGRLLPIGFASGEVPQIPANILLVKNLTVIGFYWSAYRTLRPDAMAASIEEIFEWLAAGRIRPLISDVFPLEEAGQALELISSRKATGKVVIRISEGGAPHS